MFNGVYFENPTADEALTEPFERSAIRFRQKRYPDINGGDTVLELHLDLDPRIQGKGYAINMIKTWLWREGGVGWISYGRIINPAVYKLIDKMKADNWFDVTEYDDGVTIEERI